jgi:hypothetical protein
MKRGEWDAEEVAAMKSDDDEPSDAAEGNERPPD